MKIKDAKKSLAFFCGLILLSFAIFAMAQENAGSDKNIFLDSDQDGLSDSEEKTYGTDPQNRDTDGDGYTDGAEVKSGYDPLKTAPGDKLITDDQQTATSSRQQAVSNEGNSSKPTTDNQQLTTDTDEKNLTQEVSAQVADLITTSSQEGKEISLDDLDALISQTTGETLTFEDLPEIDESSIKIKKQKYSKLSETEKAAREKEDALKYLTAVTYIMVSNSPKKISNLSDLENFFQEIISRVAVFSPDSSDISYFENLAENGKASLEQMKEVEVPEKFIDLHVKGLKLARYAVALKEEAKPDPSDPIATITNLSKIQSLINLTADFSEKVNSELGKLGIAEIPLNL